MSTMDTKKSRAQRFFEFMKHNLFAVSLIVVVISATLVLGGNVIVKEGAVIADNITLNNTITGKSGKLDINNGGEAWLNLTFNGARMGGIIDRSGGIYPTFYGSGNHEWARLLEFVGYDREGVLPWYDGGYFSVDYVGDPGKYQWNFDIVVNGAGIRTFSANAEGLSTEYSDLPIKAGTDFWAQGEQGLTTTVGVMGSNSSACLLTFTGGILTGSNCPTS